MALNPMAHIMNQKSKTKASKMTNVLHKLRKKITFLIAQRIFSPIWYEMFSLPLEEGNVFAGVFLSFC